jgi:glycosyltransferase involved in cell wall biosynthesis
MANEQRYGYRLPVATVMKICHLSVVPINVTNPKQWLTSVAYYTTILEKLARDHEVHSVHYTRDRADLMQNGVHYHFLEFSFLEMIWPQALIRFVSATRYDVVVVHGMHSVWRMNCILRSMPDAIVLCQHHGERPFTRAKAIIHKLNDRLIDGYFFSSRQLGEDWLKAKMISSPAKLFEVMEVASAFPMRASVPRSNENSFIWVGRLDGNKDPETLIFGFAQLIKSVSDASLTIISNEVPGPMIEGLIKKYQPHIEFVGGVDHDKMPQWYQRANFIISTSLFEAGGVSILEGMACGCIPLLTNIPSFRTVTGDGKIGLLFEPNSPGALASSLIKASRMDVLRERQNMIDHFTENLSDHASARKMVEAVNFLRETNPSFHAR